MINLKNLNNYIKTLRRDIAVLEYLTFKELTNDMKYEDEIEEYQRFIAKYND